MQPTRQALGFMVNGQEQEITYAELDNRARSIAAVLQELKLDGEQALLMYPPGLEYITAFSGVCMRELLQFRSIRRGLTARCRGLNLL